MIELVNMNVERVFVNKFNMYKVLANIMRKERY